MAFGNVIPIDSEVAQQLARRQLRFRLLVAALTALWLAVLVPTLVFTPLPPLAPFVALAVLVILAEHRFVLFGDETSMSASIIVVVASIFVFADTAPLAGPILIASIGGIYLPHIRTRAFSKIAFNSAGMGVAAGGAAAVVASPLGIEGSALAMIGSAALAATVYWTLNNLIVAGHQVTLCGAKYVRSAMFLIASDTDVLLWAATGAMGAIAAAGHSVTAIVFIGCVVALRVASVSRTQRQLSNIDLPARQDALLFWLCALAVLTYDGSPTSGMVAACLSIAVVMPAFPAHHRSGLAVGLPLLAIASATSGVALLICGLLAALGLVPRARTIGDSWTYCITVGTVGVAAWLTLSETFDIGSVLVVTVSSAVAPLIASGLFAGETLRRSPRIGALGAVGLIVPGPIGIVAAGLVPLLAIASGAAPLVALSFATAAVAYRSIVPTIARGSAVDASR